MDGRKAQLALSGVRTHVPDEPCREAFIVKSVEAWYAQSREPLACHGGIVHDPANRIVGKELMDKSAACATEHELATRHHPCRAHRPAVIAERLAHRMLTTPPTRCPFHTHDRIFMYE